MKRINSAPIYNLENGLVLVNCTHFGGDSSVLWRLTVASGSHKGGSGSTNVEIKANGGDMYVTFISIITAHTKWKDLCSTVLLSDPFLVL